MIRDDMIYQILFKYDFNLFRGDECISEYMKNHCTQYYIDICEAIKGNNPFLGEAFINSLKEKLEDLNYVCKAIPKILALNDEGLISDIYEESFQLFEKMRTYLRVVYLWKDNPWAYYRIREGDFRIKDGQDSIEKKQQLFHIRKSLRNRVGAYRYSIAGHPCLYLASNRGLAWFECGMPKQFSYCQMRIKVDYEDRLTLVDLSQRPIIMISNVSNCLVNERRKGNEDLNEIYRVLIDYIISYPIVAACSVKVKDRNNKFIEEYVFPQLFMQWLRESKDFDGVMYKSSLNTNLVRGMGAINIALLVKEYREDGLDRKLTEKIEISDIGFMDVNDHFKKYKNILDEIQRYINDLQLFTIIEPLVGNCVMELIEVCECIIKTYNALIDGNYVNNELIFTYLDLLYKHAKLLYENRDVKIKNYVDEVLRCHRQTVIYKDKLEEQYEKFYNLANKILHKHIAFDFKFEKLKNFEHI